MSFKKLTKVSAIEKHFWERVDKNGPKQPHMKTKCWKWKGCILQKSRYARMTCTLYGVRCFRATVVALMLKLKRPLKSKYQAQHLCNNPECTNFDHLVEGTTAENAIYSVRCGRASTGDKHWTRQHPEKVIRGKAASEKSKRAWLAHPESIRRGMKIPWAKLTDGAVQRIRKLYATGKYSQQRLAQMYSVNQFTIWAVVNNRTWKHLL